MFPDPENTREAVADFFKKRDRQHAAIMDEIEASAVAARIALADVNGIDALNYERIASGDPRTPAQRQQDDDWSDLQSTQDSARP